jgi:hypothetical protein
MMKGLFRVVLGLAIIGLGVVQLFSGLRWWGGDSLSFLLNVALAMMIAAVGAVFLINR